MLNIHQCLQPCSPHLWLDLKRSPGIISRTNGDSLNRLSIAGGQNILPNMPRKSNDTSRYKFEQPGWQLVSINPLIQFFPQSINLKKRNYSSFRSTGASCRKRSLIRSRQSGKYANRLLNGCNFVLNWNLKILSRLIWKLFFARTCCRCFFVTAAVSPKSAVPR